MKANLYDISELVELNNLQQVTSPILFQRGDVPHPQGLISNEIFGVTTLSRKTTYAYIDLKGHYLNPHVYKCIKRLNRKIGQLISGESYFIINSEGKLEEDNISGETGLDFLYDNWEKIKWADESKKSAMRNERVQLLESTPKNIIFIDKELVLPPFYRDILTGVGTGGTTDDINNMYARLIRLADLTANQNVFDFQFNGTKSDIQETLVKIYDHFKSKLEKKKGLIRKYLMGKSVDYCSRTVITAPTFHADKADDLFVNFEYSAVPCSQLCSLCYPFIFKWVKDFFEREVIDNKKVKEIYDINKNEVVSVVELDNPEQYFSDKYIKKAIDSFIKDPESRFNKIAVPVNGKTTRYLVFKGREFDTGSQSELPAIASRPMTWTDIIYMACVDVTKDKYVEITRYPINDRFGVFFSKIRPIATSDTVPMIINGIVYKWYPNININTPQDKVPIKFIDACQFSNSYLPGIEGDYDGDQTTVKVLFTQEANEEISKFVNSKSFFINDSGSNIRKVGKECMQTFFVLTKDPFGEFKELTKEETEFFLNLDPKDITFDKLVNWFGTTTKIHSEVDGDGKKTVMTGSRFNTSDTLVIPANSYHGIKQNTKTTLGRLIFDKVMIMGLGFDKIIGYHNEVLTAKKYGSIDKAITDALKVDEISVEQMKKYIDTRDWFGLQLHSVITTSFTPGVLTLPKDVQELKQKLMIDNKAEIEAGNVRVIEDIENKLIEATTKSLAGDVGLDLYISGARGSVSNHLKNILLTRGAVQNPLTKKYEIIQNSLMDGLDKKDIGTHSNMIVSGGYPKAVGTQVSGYIAKELLAAFQSEVLGDKDSDCGTSKTIPITITKKNSTEYIYRYIIESGKIIQLTNDNINKYIGKTVNMRTPMYCVGTGKNKCLCNKCAGDYYYILNNKNIGLVTSKCGTTITQLNLQKFHQNVVKTQKLDIDDLLL